MPNVLRKPPPVHVVVVDTNILWDKDKKLPVCVAFDDFWKKNSLLVPLELHLPDVVIGELQFQQTTSALKSLTTIKEQLDELSGISHSIYTHKASEATIKTQIRQKLEKWLKGHSGKIVQTPVTKIDWPAIVDAAVWRKPPFTFDPKDKNNEKGFRDALILETLSQVCKDAGAGKMVIFLCNDHLLRTAAESRLKKSSKLLAFESLADFEAYIHLTQQQFTNEFIKLIQSHARTKFYSKSDTNCIYTRFHIPAKLKSDFSTDLVAPTSPGGGLNLLASALTSTDWMLIKEKFWIRSTQFTHLMGEREFHWISRVDIVRLYEGQSQSEGLLSALGSIRKIKTVGFGVKWKANVKSDGRFHDLDVIAIEKIDSNLVDATEDEIVRLQLTT